MAQKGAERQRAAGDGNIVEHNKDAVNEKAHATSTGHQSLSEILDRARPHTLPSAEYRWLAVTIGQKVAAEPADSLHDSLLTSVVHALATVCERCLHQKRWNPIASASKCLFIHEALVDKCIDILPSMKAYDTAGVAAMTAFWLEKSVEHRQYTPLMHALLDALGKNIIGAKPTPDEHVVLAFKSVLRSTSSDTFEKHVWPAALKALRRSPEAALKPLQQVLKLLFADLSHISESIAAELVTQAHHAEEMRRASAHACFSSLGHVLHSSNGAFAVLNVLKAKLHGQARGGRVTVSDQRCGILNAIAAFAKGCNKDTHSSAAFETIHWLLDDAYPAESTEDCKIACLDALSSWSEVSEALPMQPAATEFFKGCIQNSKERIRFSALRCVICSAQSIAHNYEPYVPLLQTLLSSAKLAISKPAMRTEAAFSLCAFFCILSRDDVRQHGVQFNCDEEIAQLLLAAPHLLSADTISKLSCIDRVHLSVVGPALSMLVGVVTGFEQQQYILKSVLFAALDTSGRNACCVLENVQRCVIASPEMFSATVCALYNMIQQIQEEQFQREWQHENEETRYRAHCIERILCTICRSLNSDIRGISVLEKSGAHTVALLLLLLHHSITENQPPNTPTSRCWKQYVFSSSMSEPLERVMTDRAEDISHALLDTVGDYNAPLSMRSAAASACGSVVTNLSFSNVERIHDSIVERIFSCGVNSLTASDVLIWKTREGMLSTDEHTSFVFHSVQNRSDKKKKAGGEDSDDEGDEQPVRRISTSYGALQTNQRTEQQQHQPQRKDPKQLAREQQMEEERRRRGEIRAIQLHLSLLCQALQRFICSCPEWVTHNLHQFQFLHPLLSSQLDDGNAAFSTMSTLCKHLNHSQLAGNAPTLTAALRFVALDLDSEQGGAEHEVIQHAIHAISVATIHHGSVDGGILKYICLPILRYVLLAEHQTPLKDKAFSILLKLIRSGMEYPVKETVELLCIVSERNTAAHVSEFGALIQQAAQAMSDDDAWALLDGAFSSHQEVRSASLYALKDIPEVVCRLSKDNDAFARMFICCFDEDETCSETAQEVWEIFDGAISSIQYENLIVHLKNPRENIRNQAARALASLMRTCRRVVQPCLGAVFNLAQESAWQSRWAAARCLQEAADCVEGAMLPFACNFLIKALGDDNDYVREAAINSGNAVIDAAGSESVQYMLPTFENYFDRPSSTENDGLDEEELLRQDRIRSGVVIFLGAIARHMDQSDSKIRVVLSRLIQVISTPSAVVQRGVADCLSPLMPFLDENERRETANTFLNMLTCSESYAERRGAAFGLAGLVKGCGISSLKSFGLLDRLKEAIEDKKSPIAREGALFAFELFVQRLGRLFEPYIVQILPMLLVCFSDASKSVRSAAEGASKAIMSNLSAQGVKLVLPALIKGLEDSKWRTKQGSVQLLGAMAHLSPRQLGSALPSVVPKLTESLSDTHPKVQAAAKSALDEVASVIRNPEILQLVDEVLAAIARPVDETDRCLEELMETTFVNSVDAPSLALILPVVERGLRERQADMKKKAAKIVGNMCALVDDARNMTPYVPQLLPELRKSVLDPIPEVRTVAAKAVASLLQGLGEEKLGDLVSWLKSNLSEGESNIERSGAAQCLAECLSVLGQGRVDEIVPEIVNGCKDTRANVKDGHFELLHFLAHAGGPLFVSHLPRVFPCVLDGLSDEAEHVRDAALRAGKTMIEQFGSTHVDLLLPAIETGIVDDGWRIRHCSVELLGELLFKLSGATGRIQTSTAGDEETVSSHQQAANLHAALGEDRRNDILAALYLLRADISKAVRTTADHIWKSVVVNTPKMLNTAMPYLIDRTMASLASGSEERAASARNNIAEIVRKLGERMLNTMVPLLKDRLDSEQSELRHGVCWAVAEIVQSCTRSILNDFHGELIPMIRKGLCDESERVRLAAGDAFKNLIKACGSESAADIVPHLLSDIESNPNAVEGLKEVLKVQPDVLSSVLPKVVVEPLDEFKASVIGALAEVSGGALQSHLSKLMQPLLRAMGSSSDTDTLVQETAEASCRRVCHAVRQQHVYLLVAELSKGLEAEKGSTRFAAARAVRIYASETKCDLSEHMRSLMNTLTAMLADPDETVMIEAWHALNELVGRIAKEDLVRYVPWAREALVAAQEKERRKKKLSTFGQHQILVPGFCLEKGLAPMVQIFLQGMLGTTDPDGRQAAAEGMDELLSTSTQEAVKAHVTTICGPLIRIAREKFPWTVKAAILSALVRMIDKGRLGLKPFIPQLQTTFSKCLSDTSREVRLVAADGLGQLMALQPKAHTVVWDLVKTISASESNYEEVEATLKALQCAFTHSGDKLNDETVESACEAQEMLLRSENSSVMNAASAACGSVAQFVKEDTLLHLLDVSNISAQKEGKAYCVVSVCRRAGDRVVREKQAAEAAATSIAALAKDVENDSVRECAAAAAGWLCAGSLADAYREKLLGGCVSVLNKLLADKAADVRRRALIALKRIAKHAGAGALEPYMQALAPQLAECLTERSATVKTKAERCIRRCFNLSDSAGADAALKFVKANPKAKDKGLTETAVKRLQRLHDDSDAGDDDL